MDHAPDDRSPLEPARPLSPAEPSALEPAPLENAQVAIPPQGVARHFSRRTVLVGLGLAGLAAASGGVIWWLRSQPLIYRGHSDEVNWVAWSPNGLHIASASNDRTVQIWDAHAGTTLLTYRGHQQAVVCVAWSPDGRYLVSNEIWGQGWGPYTMRVWEAISGKTLLTRTQDFSFGRSVAWSPDGRSIASAGVAIEVWDATSGQTRLSYDQYHIDGGEDVAWSLDGQQVAAGGDDMVQIIDTHTGVLATTYNPGPDFLLRALGWSPNGNYIVSAGGSKDASAMVWSVETGHLTSTYAYQGLIFPQVTWSPDSRRLAAGVTDGTVQIWDAMTGGHLFTYTGHQPGGTWTDVWTVAWSPDGSRIASGGSDHTVQVWKPEG